MLNLGDYLEDVPFNQQAAADLIAELRHTSSVVAGNLDERRHIGLRARETWQGSYAEQFDQRVNVCLADGERFVVTLRTAADELEEMARLAQQEQLRREEVRVGLRQWEVDSIRFAEAGLPPPPVERYLPAMAPIEPPTVAVPDSPPRPRGPATPAGGG